MWARRLLRGRIFYFALLGTVLLLYLVPQHPKSSAPSQQTPQVETAPQQRAKWWPAQLEKEQFTKLIQDEPLLGGVLFGLMGYIGLIGTAGVALSLWDLIRGNLKHWFRFTGPSLPGWSFGDLWRTTALTIAIVGLIPLIHMLSPSVMVDAHLWGVVWMLILDGFVVLAVVVFATGKEASRLKVFGLMGSRLIPSVLTGLRSYVTLFPWIFAVLFTVIEIMRWNGVSPPMEPIQELVFEENRPSVLILTIFLACFLGPIAEELYFRGVVFASLRRYTSHFWAALLSGSLFAFLHTNLAGFLPILMLGMLLANVYERTGSLSGAIIIHVLHNSFLMAMGFLLRRFMA
ncbi:MAG: CPBP family intramembrane metalloprotease [Candidatus Omnitrophica bacterium]|nr:CPBP family intramembrane metalloprotease [Candidatus Omnitrophota bacterium]